MVMGANRRISFLYLMAYEAGTLHKYSYPEGGKTTVLHLSFLRPFKHKREQLSQGRVPALENETIILLFSDSQLRINKPRSTILNHIILFILTLYNIIIFCQDLLIILNHDQ